MEPFDEKAVFNIARGIQSHEERMAYLRTACVDNPGALQRLLDLLRVQDQDKSFLQSPPRAISPTLDEPVTERAGTVIGPYKLIEQIGEGGMGSVWMAQQTEPVKRLVAVKLIKAGMDSKSVIARFEAERQALALMDHPNIAKVLDAGTTGENPKSESRNPKPIQNTKSKAPRDPSQGVSNLGISDFDIVADFDIRASSLSTAGRPYFVMELVKGIPITKYCDEHHLTPRQRLELFVPVCQAVQHAHQKGVIHRDLKPSNVLVALYDDRPVPKVIDFGVAKAAGQPLTDQTLITGFGNIVGTLEYMSPEQAEINQLDIDTRSDIYSLGVLLYELLAGSPPFSRNELEKAGMLEMLRVIREQEPSKPSTKLSTAEGLPTLAANRGTEPGKLTKLLRGELDWIVMKALEKDRSRRYESANGFAMDVQRYLADEPVLACPPSTFYRVKKLLRRNKGAVLAASLVLIALVMGMIGTSWQALRAEQRAEGERRAKDRAEANFALANEAVEKYLGTVTDDPELNQSDFNRLRKKLLESALPFFQKIVAEQSDDSDVEARRGSAFLRLALLRLALGDNEAAVRDSNSTREIFTRLNSACPDVALYRRGMAKSQHCRARALSRLGNHTEAEAALGQAIDLYARLAAEFPTDPAVRDESADVHNDLGISQYQQGMHQPAEATYRRVLEMRENLAADFQDVPLYRRKLAQTLSNLGMLLTELGENEQADQALRRNLDIQQGLVDEHPDDPRYLTDFATDTMNRARLLDFMGKPLEAQSAYDRCQHIFEKLAAAFPTVPEYRDAVARARYNIGVVLAGLQQYGNADDALRLSAGIWEKLAAEFPTVPNYRVGVSMSLNSLGNVLSDVGKLPEAEAVYRQALAIDEKLVADFPTVSEYALGLGGDYCNFGILLTESGQEESALPWFQKAIAGLDALLATEPRLVQARQFLCNCHSGRARALDTLGRYAEAARDWESAVELVGGRDNEVFRRNLAESRLRNFQKDKDAAGCLAAVAEYETQVPSDADTLYNAACNRAVCAAIIKIDPKMPGADAPRLAKEQADLAMAWLNKAVAAGYRDLEHMKEDDDLDALREREDFQKLLAELARK